MRSASKDAIEWESPSRTNRLLRRKSLLRFESIT